MSIRSRGTTALLCRLGLLLAPVMPAAAQGDHSASTRPAKSALTMHARGTFEVKLAPQPADESAGTPSLGRLTLDKKFQGDLEGASRGQMLTATTGVEGSAGYVAIEQVRGTLQGRAGTFALQHSGTMTRGAPHLVITVVPDSGTEELAGLSGQMAITIADGKHSYDFEYTLPAR
jgi:hypothetical protein